MGDSVAIRHDCVRGAFISWAFLQIRVFNDANDFPWILARGDIKENLTLLKQNPISDADGACTMKIKRLVLAGYSIDHIVDGVCLLLYIGCDTFAGELVRGSSACVHGSTS